ncbi:threonine synthase [Pelotomaculum terephthalicicum JT]|uniref:threonine synthase n=1 Tax=Pelotomaculum TaxID=191373 RepID=UPI0009D28B4B|nr:MULTISPECIES: threonine synthase [Pelotomaculum]MCG9967686.1 threonine synthase [Pelotomaculum terephthalicicum JT]OPX84020.1 MAG: Threonine synthase [Pelotomaculum sp. PtaB.Bin117]OPY61482.1 MAG: Threonine synthase [Pelotomaculum sp. PtaU1.Bin065]
MLYESTRGQFKKILSAEAIKLGISPDGGLFVPFEIPQITINCLKEMAGQGYQAQAAVVLKKYFTDYSGEEIDECVSLSYNREKFDSPLIAPVRQLNDSLYVLELWHGPTCAFKDMALQILPHLLTKAAIKTGDDSIIVILVATSGDTGKAALAGFKDVPRTRIIVFYPEQGVSAMQQLQMITQEGDNVDVVAVRGNFDDAQNGVKDIFGDIGFNHDLQNKNYRLSSANSINWGRLVPQIAYYFSAYLDLVAKGNVTLGERINFVVPTGNFGNILAAYYALEMGLPVNRLICASNANNVLTDFIRTGVYNRNRRFWKTVSPSMDILISSNLERLLYHLNGSDHIKTREWMANLKDSGIFQVDEMTLARIDRLFWSGFADDNETIKTIRSIFQEYSYVVDTHTGVGINVYNKYINSTGDHTKTIIASTASPFKFNASVARAILGDDAVRGKDEFELLELLSVLSGMEIPPGLKDLDKKTILHRRTASKNTMREEVKKILTV